MMPCPGCSGLRGLARVRCRAVMAGERHYRCQDCGTLWRCPEVPADAPLTRLGAVIETHGEVIERRRLLPAPLSSLPPANPEHRPTDREGDGQRGTDEVRPGGGPITTRTREPGRLSDLQSNHGCQRAPFIGAVNRT
jgi:hypothetical protein